MKTLDLPSKTDAPKYQQLAGHLRAQISQGQLKPNDRLPTFSEMRALHSVSQATLVRAYQMLEADGLLARQQGRGTFVANDKTAPRAQSNAWLQQTIAVLTRYKQPPVGAMAENAGSTLWITRGVTDGIEGSGHHLLLLKPELFEQQVEQLAQSHPYGLIVTDLRGHTAKVGALVSALRREGVPIACYGGAPELADYDCVTSDHEAGAYQLARHLIEQGRKRIFMVSAAFSEVDDYWRRQRRAGYERALTEAGLPVVPIIQVPNFRFSAIDETEFRERVHLLAGYLALSLTASDAPDALMFDSDVYAFYAAAALRLFHRVPNDDVALAGYDNYWESSPERKFEAVGPLITMDKLNAQTGGELVVLLRARAQDQLPDEPQTRIVPPRFVACEPNRPA